MDKNRIMLVGLALILLFSAVYVITQKPSQNLRPIVIIHQTWVGDAPLYIAKEKGFFEKHGVDVEILRVETTQERRALFSSGRADMALSTIDMVVLDVGNGVPERIVFQTDDSLGANAIVAKKGINRVMDLKGKRVGAAIGQPTYFFLKVVMKKYNITKGDIDIIDLEPDMSAAALFSGDVDAAVTWDPWIAKIVEKSDNHVLVSSADTPGIVVDVMAVRPEVIKTRRIEIKGIMLAWIDAIDYWRQNPTEANHIMADAYDISDEEVNRLTAKVRWNDLKSNVEYFACYNESSGVFNVTGDIIEIAKTEKMINQNFTATELIDNTLVCELNQ